MDDPVMFVSIFSGIWALVGAIFLITGIILLNNIKKKKINCTSKTYGKVKDLVRHQSRNTDGRYSSTWHAVFEYNVGDLKFIKESSYGSSNLKYAIGQEVEICYNPEDYNEYYVVGDTLLKASGNICTVVGIISILVSIISAILILTNT